ncbi:Putative nuclease HARBI1 [Trachymyrmex cornetzi]|uniref:Putative nuclease HARBI1 n=1 Tax=Trachymyrmex cornetzi TaxID=471704 RepID=A0A151ISH2_9HYME|nr:Putative nuclease HARBI1 [Trachymyrmex cornetzi]
MDTIKVIVLRCRKYESEDSSSSDDEWELVLRKRKRRILRPRIPNYIDVVGHYMDYDFKSHLRLATFEFLLQMLRPYLTRQIKGSPMIPPHHQLMIAIWKMTTMGSYRSVCNRFNVGRATAVRAVQRVTHALFLNASTFIKWPMLVCDHRTLITHCYAGHPGSVHDQRVFRQSEVANYLNDEEKFPTDSHILGDAAYEIHQHLLTPFRDNGHLTVAQNNYNYRHSVARVTIERGIGLLKGRMRSLLHCLPMSRVDLIAEYVIARCVIHNICILRNVEIEVITIPTPQEYGWHPVGHGSIGHESLTALETTKLLSTGRCDW